MSISWKPIVEGAKAEEVLGVVREIAADLPSAPSPAEEREVSLAGGRSGQALLYGYLALHTGDDEAAEKAGELIDESAEALAERPMSPALYSGFPGVTWAIEHLRQRLFEDGEAEEGEEDEDPAQEIDEALIAPLEVSPWPGDYDLISGLVGIAVYGLERLPKPSARRVLELIVDRLDERSSAMKEGLAWFTEAGFLPPWQRELYPNGYYNLGVAHGIPAVLAVLAAIHKAGIAEEKSRRLVEGGMEWILARQNSPGSEACFGTMWTEDQTEAQNSRLAWCYGDPGVAANLLLVGRFMGRPDWEEVAVETAKFCTRRPYEQSGIRDGGLCHGGAGLVHIYNRLYQLTGEEDFAEAARFWLDKTLAMRVEGEGIAGFQAWTTVGPNMELGWRSEAGFLEGATGIGLALLGTISSVEPAWDRVLTLSLPGLPESV
jgi:lantibiotic modifying enzyme